MARLTSQPQGQSTKSTNKNKPYPGKGMCIKWTAPDFWLCLDGTIATLKDVPVTV